MKSRPKGNDQPSEEQKPVSIKIETKQCERCFAETFKGQLECDVCGLMLEKELAKLTGRRSPRGIKPHSTSWASITTIEASTCKALHSTRNHLDSSVIRREEVRARRQICSSVRKGRYDRALSLGFISVSEHASLRTQLLLRVFSMKLRTNTIASATTCCGQPTFRNQTGLRHRSG